MANGRICTSSFTANSFWRSGLRSLHQQLTRRLTEQTDEPVEPLAVQLAPDLPVELLGVPLRGDEPGKLLEAGECLLGVAHQAEVQTEPAVGPRAGARAGVQVIQKDRRIVGDRGRVELEQVGRLLVAEHVDRLGWV